jgi:hypothetical protein
LAAPLRKPVRRANPPLLTHEHEARQLQATGRLATELTDLPGVSRAAMYRVSRAAMYRAILESTAS